MALNLEPKIASNLIQFHLNLLQTWYKDWGIKINESKSVHCTFTLRPRNCTTITLNNLPIPLTQNVRTWSPPGPSTDLGPPHPYQTYRTE
jgi:hypothetical protein